MLFLQPSAGIFLLFLIITITKYFILNRSYRNQKPNNHWFVYIGVAYFSILQAVSSIVKWGYQDSFKPVFFFFLRKDFACTKSIKRKTNDFYPLKIFCAQKIVALLFSVCLILFCWVIFACDVFLCVGNLFVKKKHTSNGLDNLILLFYWGVPLSTHLSRIYLYALIFICDHF